MAAQELVPRCRLRLDRDRHAGLSRLGARRRQEGEVFGGKQEEQSEQYGWARYASFHKG